MTVARTLGLLCGSLLFIGAEGCGTPEGEAKTSPETVAHANVALSVYDANGTLAREGSAIMIGPRLALTSGHFVAGYAKWTVTTKDGKTATGVRGTTYDWMTYGSDKSHPRKTDVALVYLDQAISLAAYPKIARSNVGSGTVATRIHGGGANFENIASKLDAVSTFPHAYVTDLGASEKLDTGGAVLDGNNDIIGVVTGQGLTTGKLYIARTDKLSTWIGSQTSCASTTYVRTYELPDGGSSNGSTSSGSTSGSSGTSGTSSGSSSGDNGCNSGQPWGSSSGTHGSSGSYGTPGSSGTSGTPGSSGTSGTPGSSGTSGTPGSSGTSGTPGSSGTSGTPGSSGTSGTPGSSGTHGTPGSSGSSSVPGSSGGGGDTEVCTGPNDNPEVCPPEPDGCSGSACGGGAPDDAINYGGYVGAPDPSGNPDVR